MFFAGGGAVKFVKDYAAAGLNKTIPLVGAGFLTDGTLEAQGETAQGLLTTLHYGDGLDNPKNKAFRAAYAKAYKVEPDVYAVQGYDAAQLLIVGMNAVKGDTTKRAELVKAMEAAKIDSPRGPLALNKGHNPIHNIYLRKVEGKENKVVGIAVKDLDRSAARLQALTAVRLPRGPTPQARCSRCCFSGVAAAGYVPVPAWTSTPSSSSC